MKNKSKLVSIIVAIYKSEPFLKKLLDSIRNQTYRNIEVILIEDGSPDNSGTICDEYTKKDDRFIVIHKKNGGVCEARNQGIELATGEYISIIDGDDWLEPDYIEYLLFAALSTNSDMAMTDKIFTTRDRNQTIYDKVEVWTPEKAAASIIYPFIPIGPWNKLYKLNLIKSNNINFNVPWSGEGLYFSFMAAQYSNHVAVGHRKIYNYRLNNINSGLTNYNVQMGLNAGYNIRNNIAKNIIIPSDMIKKAVQWHIWENYNYQLFLIIATNTERNKYKKEYRKCIKHIKAGMPKVFFQSTLDAKTKTRILLKGLFPVTVAKRRLKKEKKELKKDTME